LEAGAGADYITYFGDESSGFLHNHAAALGNCCVKVEALPTRVGRPDRPI
jgi:hypothetical protein